MAQVKKYLIAFHCGWILIIIIVIIILDIVGICVVVVVAHTILVLNVHMSMHTDWEEE